MYDGSEVHEASAALASLTRAGASPVCYAPDVPQMHVIDHAKVLDVCERTLEFDSNSINFIDTKLFISREHLMNLNHEMYSQSLLVLPEEL